MAYYSQNGTGIDSNAYIYVQLQVTRTDYDTYSHFDLKSVAVSDTGTSGFIRGQVTTNQAGTSWTASTGWKDVYYNGTTTLATSSFNINRGSSDKTVRCGAYAEGGGSGIYAGGTDYAWLNVTVPKVESPNAPSNCSASYVSDSSASVTWTNGSTTTAKPRTATLIERQTDGGSWVQVATLGSSVTNWTDNGISANHSYLYRVRAQNSAGYSAYSTAPSMIFTTPAAPSEVILDKTAATTVQVDVTGMWGYAVTYDVESTYDGGSTWASVATSTSLPYSATVNAGTVQFRVRAVRGALSSAWTLSASLVTICPPFAPTIVQAPANPTAYGDGSTVAWTPNHPDGSTQASAEVKVTNPGGTSTTYTVSTATSYSFTPNATGTWTAQVRTKGLDPSYGEWSQAVSWVVANPPAVVITSPATDGTDVVALPLNVAWTVTDSTGVSAQRIIIEGSDGEILNRTLAGDVRTVALNASDVALENGQTYTIRLRVMGGSGLVTEQTRIFDVAWLAPAAPVLQLTEGEGRSATIDVMDTHYSESGATIAVDGSAIADSFTVFGASVQDGTPTPSAPVAIESVESQNLQPFFSKDFSDTSYWFYPPFTSGGVSTDTTPTATQLSDGWAHVEWSGTVSRRQLIATTPAMPTDGSIKPSSTYTLMVEVRNYSATGTNVKMIFPATDGTKAPWTTNTYQSALSDGTFYYAAATKADISAATQLRCFMVACDGVSMSTTFALSFDIRISLYEGTYGGGYMPCGAINVWACGANMLGTETHAGTVSFVTYTNGSDGSIILNGTKSGGAYAVLKTMELHLRAGTYTFCVQQVGGTATNAPTIYLLDGSGNTVTAASPTTDGALVTETKTFNTEQIVRTLRFALWTDNSVYTDAEYHVWLVRGSTATPYQPYEGDTYPIDLQGNSLRSLPDGTRDELRVEGGNAVLVKRVWEWDVSSLTSYPWQKSSSAINGFYVGTGAFSPAIKIASRGNSYCNMATGRNTTGDYFSIINSSYIDGSVNFNLDAAVVGSTVNDFKTWLATSDLKIVAELATPQTIDLGAVSDYPFIPEGGEMWVDGTEMEAVLRPADYAGQPTIESVDVQRVNADGTAWTVATGLTVGDSCIDPLPPLGVDYTYKAVASAVSGATSSAEVSNKLGGCKWALNFGQAASACVLVGRNPSSSVSYEHGGELYHFARGFQNPEDMLPEFYPVGSIDANGTLEFDAETRDEANEIMALMFQYPVAWLRTPFGERRRVRVKPSYSLDRKTKRITVSYDLIRFGEAW